MITPKKQTMIVPSIQLKAVAANMFCTKNVSVSIIRHFGHTGQRSQHQNARIKFLFNSKLLLFTRIFMRKETSVHH